MGPLPAISCRSLERSIGSYTKNIKATRNNPVYISNLIETTTLVNHVQNSLDGKPKKKVLPTVVVDLDAAVDWQGKIEKCMNRSSNSIPFLEAACTLLGAVGSFGVEKDIQGDTRQNYLVKLTSNGKFFLGGAIQNFITVTAPSGEQDLFVSVRIMNNLSPSAKFPYWLPVFSYNDDHVVSSIDAITEHVGLVFDLFEDRKANVVFGNWDLSYWNSIGSMADL
ncbi:hypothetical protein [Absidia glauca]|uniref:Uncharacterized protein n=1 Tax=Absidia glauca TaxID=4829 RepID=A0A168QQL8_ABSGL|nr:hypothetical protein [Absidia glauca]